LTLPTTKILAAVVVHSMVDTKISNNKVALVFDLVVKQKSSVMVVDDIVLHSMMMMVASRRTTSLSTEKIWI
jgi:hypothetical protein